MTTPTPQAPQKPFESTTKKLFKAFAANNLTLEQMKKIFSSPSSETINVKPDVAYDAAKNGQIRAATRNPSASLGNLGTDLDKLMRALTSPAETSTKLSAGMRESLKNIHDQNLTVAETLRSDLRKIEEMRQTIFNSVTGKSISHDDIIKLEKETGRYFIEIEALEKKIKPFLIKIELQASTIAPGIQGPKEQTKLTQ